jgi:hypothetical protein
MVELHVVKLVAEDVRGRPRLEVSFNINCDGGGDDGGNGLGQASSGH